MEITLAMEALERIEGKLDYQLATRTPPKPHLGRPWLTLAFMLALTIVVSA